MKQPFDTGELKAELEHALGFSLVSLVRLDGASALNFKAVRAGDGLQFAVKCSPPCRRLMHEHLVRHLDEMRGTKAVKRIFVESAPASFRGFDLVCLAWCPGERKFPDELSPSELDAFLCDYLALSAAMQQATLINHHDPTVAWREAAWMHCSGFWGRWLRRLMDRELSVAAVTYRRELVKTVHGDFHHGNFLFVAGRVSGYFDLEEFCEGYPTDDIVRYFVCAAEHLRWYQLWRLERLKRRFALAVKRLPYSNEEWNVAINCLFLRKLYFKTETRRPSFARTVNLLFRHRLYRELKRIVEKEKA